MSRCHARKYLPYRHGWIVLDCWADDDREPLRIWWWD